MKTWVRRSLNAGALTAGALLATGVASGAAAQASPVLNSGDNIGILNGTQANVPIDIDADICGTAVGVAGGAWALCDRSASALDPEWSLEQYLTTGGNSGALNGTQANVPVNADVDVCGTAVGALLGAAVASCEQTPSDYPAPPPPREEPPGYEDPAPYGFLSSPELGNVLGSAGALTGGVENTLGSTVGGATEDTSLVSGANHGIANGTQLNVPVHADIDICGTAVGVLGLAGASC